MKKILGAVLILSGLLLFANFAYASGKQAPSSFIYQAVNKYKAGNYTGCIQDMNYLIKKGKANDISYYYLAMSYSRIGMSKEAKEAYEKAIELSKNMSVLYYANQGLYCLDNLDVCQVNKDNPDSYKTLNAFIKSDKFMDSELLEQTHDEDLENVRTKINNGEQLEQKDIQRLNYNNQTAPSDKEIADAVRTFQKLGINPLSQINQMNGANTMYAASIDPQLMQLNALFGNNSNNNNNNMMNLIPYLTQMKSNSGNTQMSKDMVQAMMMNQMLPSFNFNSNDK